MEKSENSNALKNIALPSMRKRNFVDVVERFWPPDYSMLSTSCSNVSLLMALLRMLLR